MMGMGMSAMGNLVGAGGAGSAEAAAPADPAAQLAQYKKMLDDGLINEEDYEALKKKALGI